MAANLFTAQLETLTAADVEAFLDLGLEEGPRLDYKATDRTDKGIPDSALKTIVAFANTYGGLLVLGVGIDKATNRPATREGLQMKSSFEEQLTSRCYGFIQPPLTPEIRVCPFKSTPTLPADDRAFVIVRIAPSPSAPHATRENQVYVRVGSESQLADLTTLRALFERQQQREQQLAEVAATVRRRGESVYTRFKPEWQGGTVYSSRWQHRWPAVIAEFLPLDAPSPLFSFVAKGIGTQTFDDHILELVSAQGWMLAKDFARDKLDDVLREPEGLGVVAPFTANIVSLSVEDFRSLAPTTWYIDRSGGALLILPEANLRWPPTLVPQAKLPHEPLQITPLLYQLRQAMLVLWAMLREHGYRGRVQATVWYWHGQSQAFDFGVEQGHRGQVVMGLEDSWETQSRDLASLVSQMTRSWLSFPFVLQKWLLSDLPVLG